MLPEPCPASDVIAASACVLREEEERGRRRRSGLQVAPLSHNERQLPCATGKKQHTLRPGCLRPVWCDWGKTSQQEQQQQRGPEGPEGGGGSGWKKGRAFHLSFISVTQSSVQCPIQWLAPALCKIMLIPLLPVLSHLYKLPSRPLKSNYISLRCCQEKKKKTGLAFHQRWLQSPRSLTHLWPAGGSEN